MKTFKHLLPIMLFLFSVNLTQAQNNNGPLPDKVVQAVKQGNAAGLSSYLNSRIELVLPGESGVFSKEQAHFILKNFFDKNKVTSFQVLHHGSRQNATFAIGQYKCPSENYRMYFLVKNSNNKPLIHQIRIEKQE